MMDLDELERLEQAATAGPWSEEPDGDMWQLMHEVTIPGSENEQEFVGHDWVMAAAKCKPCYEGGRNRCMWPRLEDASAIIALRNAAHELIAAVRQRDRLLALLREIEDLDDARPCPICGYYGMNHEHLDDCALARELTAGGAV